MTSLGRLFATSALMLLPTQASALTMLLNLKDFDPTDSTKSYTNPSKEIRYQKLATQSRFAAIGSFAKGVDAGARSNSCTGTLIGAHTVLTAAHCVWNKVSNRPKTRSELEFTSFNFGVTPNSATETLRVTDYYVYDRANFKDQVNGGRDYALLQVYGAETPGDILGSTVGPMSIYSGTDEQAQLGSQYALMSGYGWVAYNQPGLLDRDDQIKRVGLNDRLERFDSDAVKDDHFVFTFNGGGELAKRELNPFTFLESGLAYGDSGGALMMRAPDGSTQIIGVNSYINTLARQGISGKNPFQDNFPGNGGTESVIVRTSLFYSDIMGNLQKAPDAEHIWSFKLPAEERYLEMIAASPVELALTVSPSMAEEVWGFDYNFVDGGGDLSVFFGADVLFHVDASAGTSGHVSFTVNGADLWLKSLSVDGLIPVDGDLDIRILFNALKGQRVFVDNINFGSNLNGDFKNGLLGYTVDSDSHFALVDGSMTGSTPAVPEPSTWLTLSAGFALAGASLRKCKSRSINAT